MKKTHDYIMNKVFKEVRGNIWNNINSHIWEKYRDILSSGLSRIVWREVRDPVVRDRDQDRIRAQAFEQQRNDSLNDAE